MIERILIVCDGNACRSPMASAMLARALPFIQVRSAGLIALAGRPAAQAAIDAMRARGFDLTPHIAQPVHLGHVRASQLILAMTLVQCREIERRYPFARGRVFQLDHATKRDIEDPVGKSADVFEAVAAHIERAVAQWIVRIPAAAAHGGA
ncbi:protein tyrosine phosphatase [Burkholderia vietnamiensis]|uniref:arsenate reductase/protein-tyrosine-phosphatase family protein n=1 Tax=Burkholderia vietnamiensis TaxID=60552 RepID=UPI000758E935|nr:protein tyrosine phosphatase [Burkholderia vietnamiensis]KVF67025.1 protein tyrosine phosphatase [Burkholderia vietnamiensis]KVF75507.1 protein tyrosine phosphatase [Burkholderia vietnamiensis]KVF83367.1 protein tyrosine phosphatase [Burkholderia vietnamiensis]KVF88093.1 protein tyrosine phosphatase [Burkholderia vietnamiensis]KVG00409.1 protein tyrosine phosphatase [Burkholderia vietnamiensis]